LGKESSNVATMGGIFDINKVKSMAIDSADSWNIPTYLIAFISNSLDQNHAGRVLPWAHFRKFLYEVYDERIRNSPEI
jgi:hypothetical protein